MLTTMEPEAVPVRVLAPAVAIACATLEQLHGSRSSTDPTVCSAMNRFNVSDETRVRRPTLTYAIRRALSQLRNVPGRMPMYSAASSTESSGPGRCSFAAGVFIGLRQQREFPSDVCAKNPKRRKTRALFCPRMIGDPRDHQRGCTALA